MGVVSFAFHITLQKSFYVFFSSAESILILSCCQQHIQFFYNLRQVIASKYLLHAHTASPEGKRRQTEQPHLYLVPCKDTRFQKTQHLSMIRLDAVGMLRNPRIKDASDPFFTAWEFVLPKGGADEIRKGAGRLLKCLAQGLLIKIIFRGIQPPVQALPLFFSQLFSAKYLLHRRIGSMKFQNPVRPFLLIGLLVHGQTFRADDYRFALPEFVFH